MNQLDVTIVVAVVFVLSTFAVLYATRKVVFDALRLILALGVWLILWALVAYVLFRIGVISNIGAVVLILLFATPFGIVAWLELYEKDDVTKKESLEDRIKKSIEDSKK
ncbi:MAG: hypothetical protein HKN57_14385 [Xanthomonadales bacterium]|nr:hypothetical protein [Xanthomonadales bacterium]